MAEVHRRRLRTLLQDVTEATLALKWTSTEALRLVAWLLDRAGAGVIEQKRLVDAPYEELREFQPPEPRKLGDFRLNHSGMAFFFCGAPQGEAHTGGHEAPGLPPGGVASGRLRRRV